MQYRNLGRSGLKVSTLCLGGMTFGEADASSMMHGASSSEAEAHAVLTYAVAAGINFIDVADVYGQDGLAERVLGNWLTQNKNRDDLVLATKFRFRMGPGPNQAGASRYRIVRTVEDSLRRMQTDRIDLYQIHAQDLDVPEDEILRALDDLVRSGKVLYIGCSNYAAYRMVESLYTSEQQRLERFVSLQAQYNLVVRDLEREHVPASLRHGLGILPWSPLAGGFLSGKYRKDAPPPSGSRFETTRWKTSLARHDSPRNWQILAALDVTAAETGSTVAAVALAWLLHKPAVTSVIFGARTVAQLQDNLKAADVSLSPDQMARLDAASAFDVGYPYEFLGRLTGGKW
jgi:aryl-alcohol dehydrogenase-like predicted oxidoreductase